MPNVITNIVPTTELEAVNTMLASIGEAQLPSGTDLSAVTAADQTLAVDLLRKATREMLDMRWRFNTEEGLELAPIATYNWVDTAGITTLLNIFQKPTGLLAWRQSACNENRNLDLIERVSKKFTPATVVLYDRAKNRDGVDAGQYPHIYIDAVWAVDFDNLPECARRFATVRASRQFAQQALSSDRIADAIGQDELFALRLLKREQGIPRKANILDNSGVRGALGGRPNGYGYWTRVFPGGA